MRLCSGESLSEALESNDECGEEGTCALNAPQIWLGGHIGNIGIMEEKMEATTMGLPRVWGLDLCFRL